MVRITIDGTQAQFSCKTDVDPNQWDIPSARATGRSDQARKINSYVEKMRVSIHKHYQEICDRDNFVTAEKVKNAFLGIDKRCNTLLKIYERHNEDFSREVEGSLKAMSTFKKYEVVYEHLKDFLSYRYNLSDISLKEITAAFINDFELYLRTIKKCCHNTVWIYMMPLRRMIAIAIKNRWLNYDPFVDYDISMEETYRGFLTKDILMQIARIDLKNRRDSLELVRDLFLFCSFTGISFCDIKSLSKDDIITGNDGYSWVIKQRGKTGVLSSIRLMDIPLQIIEKYRDLGEGDKIFPVPSYPTCNGGLKKIFELCKIDKHVSWHQSRHTYATEVCLTNGISIESLSKMLGHKNIKTTQIYAKITNEKISMEIDQLSLKLEQIEQFKAIAI